MRKTSIYILIVLLVSFEIIVCANNDSLKIQSLELEIEQINKHDLKNINYSITELKKEQKEISELVDKHDELYKKYETYLGVLLILLPILGFAGWESIKSRAKERIEKALTEESSSLSKMFHDANREKSLIKNTSILILTEDGTENDNLKLLLKRHNFSDVSFKKFDKDVNINGYTLVIFTDKNFSQEKDIKANEENEIRETVKQIVINNSDSICYFYFGTINLDSEIIQSFKYKVSSSRFPSQIIGNIMNLLKYN